MEKQNLAVVEKTGTGGSERSTKNTDEVVAAKLERKNRGHLAACLAACN